MKENSDKKDTFPEDWPTHKGAPEFWEEIGRTVASFAVLEDILARVLVAVTGSREYDEEEVSKEDLQDLVKQLNEGLEKPMYDNLTVLINRLDETHFPDEGNFGRLRVELVRRMRLYNPWRYAISHGAWVEFQSGYGPARLKYVRRTGDGLEGFTETMSRNDLVEIRGNVNVITHALLIAMQMQKIELPDIGP